MVRRAYKWRSSYRCPYCRTINPVASKEAKALRRLIDDWFFGNRTEAAAYLQIHRTTLHDYTSGKRPVSKPVLAKMVALKRLQKRRRNKERLELAEREASIIETLAEI